MNADESLCCARGVTHLVGDGHEPLHLISSVRQMKLRRKGE